MELLWINKGIVNFHFQIMAFNFLKLIRRVNIEVLKLKQNRPFCLSRTQNFVRIFPLVFKKIEDIQRNDEIVVEVLKSVINIVVFVRHLIFFLLTVEEKDQI